MHFIVLHALQIQPSLRLVSSALLSLLLFTRMSDTNSFLDGILNSAPPYMKLLELADIVMIHI